MATVRADLVDPVTDLLDAVWEDCQLGFVQHLPSMQQCVHHGKLHDYGDVLLLRWEVQACRAADRGIGAALLCQLD